MPIAGKFERWHIDFIGPLTTAKDGSKHILLLVDSLTRWPEAFSLKTQEASEVAHILYNDIFTRYGAPKYLVSDRGQNFMSKLMTAICELFDVKRHHTSAYHPQTNSTCERLNSTIEQSLRAYIKEDHSDWPKVLPGILMSYRKSPSTNSTKFSPYNLVFGVEMNIPYDVTMIPTAYTVRMSTIKKTRQLRRHHTFVTGITVSVSERGKKFTRRRFYTINP